MKENSKAQKVIRVDAAQALYDSIGTFKETAVWVEEMISRRGLRIEGRETLDRWNTGHLSELAALKTVSHYNLSVALELLLKFLLALNQRQIPKRHELVLLYEHLPESVQTNIQAIYDERDSDVVVLGILSSFNAKGSRPEMPQQPDMPSFRTLLKYLDEEVSLSAQRFSFEWLPEQRWRLYLDDICVLVGIIEGVMRAVGRPWSG